MPPTMKPEHSPAEPIPANTSESSQGHTVVPADINGRLMKQPSSPSYIVVEGPIGVGKTSLARRLSQHLDSELLLELPEENPFLERFYRDPKQSALPTQLFFLFQRIRQIQEMRQSDLFQPTRVSDFLLEKDRLFAQLTLDDDELRLYDQVYEQLSLDAPKPDLVIYLQAPVEVLRHRISQRGVTYEQGMDADYLRRLSEAYSRFFHFFDQAPLLIVNASEIDFVNNVNDFQALADMALSIENGRHYFNPLSAERANR